MCEFKFGLNETACNSKQKWKHDECRRECQEVDDSKDDYMWNPITCDCECNKPCKIEKYLDIKTCSCKNAYFVY